MFITIKMFKNLLIVYLLFFVSIVNFATSKAYANSKENEKLDLSSYKADLLQIENYLNNITHPYYYEIRLSNKCNLMCRSCKPEHSHLIDREYKKFNIIILKTKWLF